MSVVAQEPNFKALTLDPYTNKLIHGVLSECLEIARRQNCVFSKTHINDTIAAMTANFPLPDEAPVDPSLHTTMYQDLLAGPPLEVEVYLGNPVRMAEAFKIDVPNLQVLYGISRQINKNRTKPQDIPKSPQPPVPRQQPRQSLFAN